MGNFPYDFGQNQAQLGITSTNQKNTFSFFLFFHMKTMKAFKGYFQVIFNANKHVIHTRYTSYTIHTSYLMMLIIKITCNKIDFNIMVYNQKRIILLYMFAQKNNATLISLIRLQKNIMTGIFKISKNYEGPFPTL